MKRVFEKEEIYFAAKLCKRVIVSVLSILFSLAVVQPADCGTITVSTVSQLVNAVTNANSSGGNTTILLQDGTYTLSDTLYVNSPNVTIASVSGFRQNVVIEGDAMSGSAQVGNLLRITGINFQIRDLTLQKCRWHLIQIVGEENADSPMIRNCVFRDSYEQMLKVTLDPGNPGITADNGIVENCLFEYSAGIGPQYYIGGVDAHGAKNWTVRSNTFRSIISPGGAIAEFAVHFWNGSANNVVERNLIFNCDRGIGFGLDTRPNTGGIIRNNMIYHSSNHGQYDDVAIALTESPGSQVYNNTIFMENDFPWAIEYRFSSTTNVLIANNVTNKPIMSRDGATGTVTKNVTNAAAAWFMNPANGDLRLSSPVASVVDLGQAISGLIDDFDGQIRPQGPGIDLGADEFQETSDPLPPKNLRILNP